MLENSTINIKPAHRADPIATDGNPSQTPITYQIASIKNPPITYTSASLLGDHSVCDPPDPFSNSAVKPVRANGTNAQALEE